MKLASRMKNLGTESAFEVLAKAKKLEASGKDIVHLEIGEPDFDTPPHIVEAAKLALDSGFTHYNPAPGIPELRDAIATEVNKSRGIDIQSENVVVVPGGKPIIFYIIQALVDEGDEVIYPNPGFPIYQSVIDFVGGKSVPVHLKEENDFRLSIDDVAGLLTAKTKLIILNSPQNPTGGVLEKSDLDALAELLQNRDVMVLSDEIYSRIIYDGFVHDSLTSRPGMLDKTVILDGFSKAYAMTGWRMGYGIMPLWLAKAVAQLAINCNSCTATFTQKAGIAALTGNQSLVESMVREFRARRDVIVNGLNAIPGISCLKPKGAFYVFPNIQETGYSSANLQTLLLEEAGVASLSGTAFGQFGEGYLRFSYANSIANIEKALVRIKRVLAR
jgi:aspartate/methionine/tyrosine aminotransferase